MPLLVQQEVQDAGAWLIAGKVHDEKASPFHEPKKIKLPVLAQK